MKMAALFTHGGVPAGTCCYVKVPEMDANGSDSPHARVNRPATIRGNPSICPTCVLFPNMRYTM